MICKKCNKAEATKYEEIGEGKYCQECLNEEIETWKKESGFY